MILMYILRFDILIKP